MKNQRVLIALKPSLTTLAGSMKASPSDLKTASTFVMWRAHLDVPKLDMTFDSRRCANAAPTN